MSDSITFIWLTGHVRNVGDSMLRRPYAETISEVSDIYVWAGDPSSGYVQGLQIDPSQLAPSFREFYVNLVRRAVTGKVHFAFNAGQVSVTKAFFSGFIPLLPWLVLAKIRGGKIIWAGAEIASRKRGFFWTLQISARLSNLLYWRDCRSKRMIGFGGERPDWGFALRSGGVFNRGHGTCNQEFPGFGQRQYLGISLRGDRPYPSQQWLEAVRSFATTHNYRILAISQVEDDSAYAERIARELAGESLLWSGGDHFAQEQRVRGAYQECVAVLSDRLHGLIIAATEGAVPLGWVEAATDKLERHFKVVQADWAVPSDNPMSQIAGLTKEQLLNYYEANLSVVRQSRERVLTTVAEIQQLLSTDARS